jgi:nicotinic acid phosphoribosyltransferase
MVNSYETDYPFVVENMLHAKFFNKKLLNEWFALEAEDVSSFIEECHKADENIAALQSNPFFKKHLKG